MRLEGRPGSDRPFPHRAGLRRAPAARYVPPMSHASIARTRRGHLLGLGRCLAAACLAGALLPSAARAQALVPPRRDYDSVAAALTRFIQAQMAEKHLPALSIALVDNQETVWARGFGAANPADGTPATA